MGVLILGALFGVLIRAPDFCQLESWEVVKVIHDCRMAADVLQALSTWPVSACVPPAAGDA